MPQPYLPTGHPGREDGYSSTYLPRFGCAARRPQDVPRTIPTYLLMAPGLWLQEHIAAAPGPGQVIGSRRMVATTIPAYHPTRTMAAEAHTYLAWVVPVGEPGAGYKNHTYLRAR